MTECTRKYLNKDMSNYLNIGESTLRKWCIELEKNGYKFIKGTKDSRAFTDHDMQALLLFKQLTRINKQTKEQAATDVVEKFSRNEGIEEEKPDHIENNRLQNIEKMIQELLKNQVEINRALTKKLEQQEKYIKELLDRE
ncbi:hypothetical protein [Peribacillus sp. TH24]|uniref:hypothetical protein n=1 Tax=Peribacillus sp. TH24 TaxID=2798483 RepID=UPI0019134BA7|nr:hypothetical protein [Peribacillus sp. TH24]MBK5447041.1 hypothetical protein [Peribacillus sp. TH24]MBK5447072.1 hypothetical protein [Peribacillus sp. TH24]